MSYSSSAVYEINYHIVWCTKYRKQVMNDELKEFLDDQIRTIADSKEWEILELEVMPEHIHLFISAPPFMSPTDIVKIMKGVTTKRVFQKFPELRKKKKNFGVITCGHQAIMLVHTVKYLLKQLRNT